MTVALVFCWCLAKRFQPIRQDPQCGGGSQLAMRCRFVLAVAIMFGVQALR